MYDPLQIQGKKITIIGLGLLGGGIGVVKYCLDHGAHVIVIDAKPRAQLLTSIASIGEHPHLQYIFGEAEEKYYTQANMVLKGPSVRWDNQGVLQAQAAGVYVTMETALFVKHAPCKTIGITGTRGKSTTTHLVYTALQKLYTRGKVYQAGNIPGTCALSLLDKVKPEDIVVLELSSWQLSGFHREHVSPTYGVFTNLYPDHLNYYHSMDAYQHDKEAIYKYQRKSCFVDGRIFQDVTHYQHNNIRTAQILLECVLGKSKSHDIAHALATVKGLPYRSETIAQIKNVRVINDTTSTTPIALQAALQTYTETPIFLCIGGNAKGLPIEDLVHTIQQAKSIKRIFCMPGSFTDQIFSYLPAHTKPSIIEQFDVYVYQALRAAREYSKSCILLFSPGATSFAQFKNEFDRGEQWNMLVNKWVQE